ncbi:hypothetical protein MHTCC0001_00230 [Flavobacteriaceae bacterium MHTCC 0001]
MWKGNTVFNLEQFDVSPQVHKIDIAVGENLRLGKYVERLVAFQLRQQPNIHVLAENIQIQKDKITLGELDCLLLKAKHPIHLEIIYKFYLYDADVGKSEIDHFIGPNRKDALIEKLIKLKEKQLPLLYSNPCMAYIDRLGLNVGSISQQVYFKAQLFLPYSNQNIQLETLSNDCVVGFYITKKELKEFTDCKFYIPVKKNWLVYPHTNVSWLSFSNFKDITNDYFKQKFSTLCWVKSRNGGIKKVFLVWW